MNHPAIDEFESGIDRVKKTFAGLSNTDLDAVPVPGTWTLRQILFHLMHSDAIGIDRMSRTAYETSPPLLIGYNENNAQVPLFTADHPPAELLTVFELNRRTWVRILRRLPQESLAKFGIHNEAGKQTLEDQLKKYAWHADHHLEFARKKRALLGKPVQP
jgi:uncharacterized damage-inducible protein DinB